jgi:hypothetical protein
MGASVLRRVAGSVLEKGDERLVPAEVELELEGLPHMAISLGR